MGEIKDKLEELYKQTAAIQDEITALRAVCKHESGWTEGLSMIGCIAPVLFCNECSFVKPIPPDEENGLWIVRGC